MSGTAKEVSHKQAWTKGPETWTPEQMGHALHMVYILANTPVSQWRSKSELYEALSEFRSDAALTKAEGGKDV